MNSRRLVSLCMVFGLVVGFLPSVGSAQPYNLDARLARPALDSRSLITVDRSRPLGTLEPSIGLYMNYGWRPVKQTIDGQSQALIEHLVTGQFMLTLDL